MNPQVRRAVALALATGAIGGTAHAIDITTVPSTNVLYAGGSSADSASLTEYFVQSTDSTSQPCDESNPLSPGGGKAIDYYTDTAGTTQFFAVACIASASMGALSGQPIAFVKELNAGSYNGLGPVGADSTLTFPDITTLLSPNYSSGTTPCTTGTVGPVTLGASTYAVGYIKNTCVSLNNHTTSSAPQVYTTIGTAPNIGFADADPTAFGTSTAALSITTGQTVDIIFAPAVSLGLYHALQAAEGIANQDDNVTDIPALTRNELEALYTGAVSSWATLQDINDNPVSGEAVQFGSSSGAQYGGSGNTTTASSAQVYFCRRDDYSGTERIDEIYYANQNCVIGGSVNVFSAESAFTDSTGVTNNETFGNAWVNSDTSVPVFAANSTGYVLQCLQAHDSVGHFAIGYASIDNGWGTAQSTTTRRDFRYIKVNDVVPSVENAAAGRWQIWAQSIYALPSNTSLGNYPAGNANTIAHFMTSGNTAFGKAQTVAAVNLQDQWGLGSHSAQGPIFDGGLLAIPTSGVNTPNASSVAQSNFITNPVNDFVHAAGSTLNNCQPPAKFRTTTSLGANGSANWVGP